MPLALVSPVLATLASVVAAQVLYCTVLCCTVLCGGCPGSPHQLHPPAAPRPGQALRGVILGVLERLARLPRGLCCLPQGCPRHAYRVMSGTLDITHITALPLSTAFLHIGAKLRIV